jgi:SAM-dependent methyltransferase
MTGPTVGTGDRYELEREQGERFASEELEAAWGWTSPAGTRRADRRARFLQSAAGLTPHVECLELGCGTGEFTVRLQHATRLTALELSAATAERARTRVAGAAEIVVGNAETGEGLDGRTFDAIVGVSVLHHLKLDRCFEHSLSRLRPGGRFAFSEPNLLNPQVYAERRIAWLARRRHVLPHETAFRTKELRAAFEERGFVVDVCEPFDFLHPATPARLVGVVERLGRVAEATPLRHLAGSIRIAGHRPR